ncbi:hypothetical protein [Rickettsia endosymbiont of Ixodes scapularis]|uniref:hypothetical protein n=1 Tax=Rickettsia endosymbiont of Ixodes scapularis TaxID=444612 RepID=UPI0002E36570|nr:hypothetical protein [Rickettsia endosymbiont of Ixodes scapularis]
MTVARDACGDILVERELAQQKPATNTTSKLIGRLQKNLSAIDSFVFDNHELIELKKCDLLENQKVLSDLKQEEQVKENFIETLLPHYLGRVYQEQGAEIIAKWEAVKDANSNIGVLT